MSRRHLTQAAKQNKKTLENPEVIILKKPLDQNANTLEVVTLKSYGDDIETHEFEGGDRYEGTLHQDTGAMHGRGQYWFNGGDYFDGEWKDGAMHGKGYLKLRDGGSYQG